ncbi:MAG TPA: metalloregulator ArsR/SmtB family transcription factor [Bacillales bacterium]|nr:metalloregulator ArsR/SmtB family transcription factor [Bacillales bacterium]
MEASPNVAEAAALLSESSRAAMLTALMDGRFHTATELAYMAGIKQQTASFHLSKLTAAHFIQMEKHGRYRYYKLANQKVAEILESFLSLSRPPEIRSLRQSSQMKALRSARTCYDHLAGELGVQLTQSMLEGGYLEKAEKHFCVTSEGERFFEDFGMDLAGLHKKRRSFSRACLDWSERQHHLAGALGQGIAARLFELQWIARIPSSRAVKVTEKGQIGLEKMFGLK